MKAISTVIQAILILVVSASLLAITLPWTLGTLDVSIDATEISSIKAQFDVCSDRILETARTGSTTKCIFNIKNGKITGKTEGIYYSLLSKGHICDPSPLVEIDNKTHVWQECNVTGSTRIFGMLWMFPKELEVTGTGIEGSKMQGQSEAGDINFGESVIFRTISLNVDFQYQPGESGKIIELTRIGVTEQNVTMRVKFVG
jgi:hypothetical protein